MVATHHKGRLALPGQTGSGLAVDLILEDQMMAVVAGDNPLGEYPVREVNVERVAGDRFRFRIGNEQFDFTAADPVRFFYDGVPMIQRGGSATKNKSRFRALLGAKERPKPSVARNQAPAPAQPAPQPVKEVVRKAGKTAAAARPAIPVPAPPPVGRRGPDPAREALPPLTAIPGQSSPAGRRSRPPEMPPPLGRKTQLPSPAAAQAGEHPTPGEYGIPAGGYPPPESPADYPVGYGYQDGYVPSPGGYDPLTGGYAPPEAYVPAPEAYSASADGYDFINGGYALPPEAYALPPEAYVPPADGYELITGGYAPPPEAYAPPPEAYAPPPEAYAPPPEAYAPPPEAFVPSADGSELITGGNVPPPGASVPLDAFPEAPVGGGDVLGYAPSPEGYLASPEAPVGSGDIPGYPVSPEGFVMPPEAYATPTATAAEPAVVVQPSEGSSVEIRMPETAAPLSLPADHDQPVKAQPSEPLTEVAPVQASGIEALSTEGPATEAPVEVPQVEAATTPATTEIPPPEDVVLTLEQAPPVQSAETVSSTEDSSIKEAIAADTETESATDSPTRPTDQVPDADPDAPGVGESTPGEEAQHPRLLSTEEFVEMAVGTEALVAAPEEEPPVEESWESVISSGDGETLIGDLTPCPGLRADGEPCGSLAVGLSGFCFAHDPARAVERRLMDEKVSQTARRARSLDPDLEGLVSRLEIAVSQVHEGVLDPPQALAMASLVQAMCDTLEVADKHKR